MKTLLVLAALSAIVLYFWIRGQAPRLRAEGPVSAWIIPDEWSVNLIDQGGKIRIVRFNSALGRVAEHAVFRKKVSISVPFANQGEQGLPTPAEDRELSEIEEQVLRRFTVANESLFAGVITAHGMREFVFYTSNEAAAVAKAEALVREIRHRELRFSVSDDPEWKAYKASVGP